MFENLYEAHRRSLTRAVVIFCALMSLLSMTTAGSTLVSSLTVISFWVVGIIIYRHRHAYPHVAAYIKTIHAFHAELDRVPTSQEQQLVPDAQTSRAPVQLSSHEHVEFLKIVNGLGPGFGKRA